MWVLDFLVWLVLVTLYEVSCLIVKGIFWFQRKVDKQLERYPRLPPGHQE